MDFQLKHPARVCIIGGGFGGISTAKALSSVDAEVIIIDQRNHHVFQPLLYQVATAALSPADIAAPIRHIFREQRNCKVILGKVETIDLKAQYVSFHGGKIDYDWLVIAAGATHSYFGKPEWEKLAPGLKSIEDATEIRRRILLAFENAEYEAEEEQRKSALTFAIIGGGPTGVELAGAIQEIAAQTIQEDFRNIDTTTTRVILIQGADRVLPQFDPALSEKAKRDLEEMGVEVMLSTRVTNLDSDGIYIGETFLPVKNIFWAAGVQGNPIGKSLGVPLDKSGRVVVNSDLTVTDFKNVFVIGDLASALSASTGEPVPGVAQGALQMGHYVGTIIKREITDRQGENTRLPFSYRNKGTMATIGKSKAVAEVWKLRISGFIAWLLWGIIHVLFLVSYRNRFSVAFSWIYQWFTSSRQARLITGEAHLTTSHELDNEIINHHQI